MNTDKLYQLFDPKNQWDLETPSDGHEKRFKKKLKNHQLKTKINLANPFTIAAIALVSFGVLIFTITNNKSEQVAFSPQVQETHDYFSLEINHQLENLKKKETLQSKTLIEDALKEIKSLEKDYQNLKLEIAKNGETKQIVFAILTNLQTRISFIKTVLEQVENINTIENEKHI